MQLQNQRYVKQCCTQHVGSRFNPLGSNLIGNRSLRPPYSHSLFSFLCSLISQFYPRTRRMEKPQGGVFDIERQRRTVSLACPDRSVLIFGVKLALASKELISTSLHKFLRKAGHRKGILN